MEVIGQIQRGAFGVVERVRLDDGVIAARKTYDPKVDELRSPKVRERFCREARMQKHLGGLYVIPVLTEDLSGDAPWYVMPLADTTLLEHMHAHPPDDDSWPRALMEVLDALEHIHAREVFHRDFKPSNVLLHDGRWKLSDFGIALPALADTTRFTSTASVWGTTGYMSPEQTKDFHNVDARTDIYAFGCTLHLIYAKDKTRVPHHEHSCEGPMGPVISRCTKVDPDQRFATIADLRTDLLAAALSVTPSEEEEETGNEEWADQVREGRWDAANAVAFADYLKSEPPDAWAPLRQLRPSAIQAIHAASSRAWTDVAKNFCGYVKTGSFQFEFCDVLVGSLGAIYSLGGVAIRSMVVHTTAALGASHNRWFVMEHLRTMAGPNIEEVLADRIVMDGNLMDHPATAKANLEQCATRIGAQVATMYHPTIVRWIAS